MATIKGQKLRLFLCGKCVAASTNTTFHVSAQVEDVSTKDSDSDWTENEVVGFNFDASVEGLIPAVRVTESEPPDIPPGQSYQSPLCGIVRVENLDGGDFEVSVDGKFYPSHGEHITVIVPPYSDLIIYNKSSALQHFVITTTDDDAHDPSDLLEALESKIPLDFNLSTTSGARNRDMEGDYLSGKLVCTDFTYTAGNKAKATFSANFTGTGALEKY